MSTEQLPDGLQLAIELIEPESEDAACDRWVESERPHGDAEAVQRQWEESRQRRWTLQANRAAAAIHATNTAHAAALARIAELEAERDEWKQNARNVMDADLVQRAALEQERELRELRARLADIEAQEPVMWRIKQGDRAYVISNDEFVRLSFDAASMTPLYAKPIPATAGPVAWIEHELSGTGQRHLHFERRPSCLRDEVLAPVWAPLFSGPVPAQAVQDGWRLVLTEARDLFAAYAEIHRARGPEHAAKAARNEAMATKINAALAASQEHKA